MDDIMGKLTELLSDEESVRQLSELAQMMSADIEGEDHGPEAPDMSGLMKLSGLLSSAKTDDSNTALLTALKPHLRPERQQRVDKAIKILKILTVWDAAKESGMLNDIL